MRVSDDRYSRDRLRFDIAVQFIQHEARTRTIRAWTGLSDDRIRKLYWSVTNVSFGSPKGPSLTDFVQKLLRLNGFAGPPP